MANEFAAAYEPGGNVNDRTDLKINIIGCHEFQIKNNTAMFANRNRVWLREDAQNRPWLNWGSANGGPVTDHDFVIVDATGRFAGKLNVARTPLEPSGTNYNLLKNTLKNIATITDSDDDGLPDYWENLVLGNINAGYQDETSFGVKNLFAYAVSMQDGTYRNYPLVEVVTVGGQSFFQMTIRRRLGLEGTRFLYTPQRLDASLQVVADPRPWIAVGTPTVIWDGTGTQQETWRCPEPIGTEASFVRLEIKPAS